MRFRMGWEIRLKNGIGSLRKNGPDLGTKVRYFSSDGKNYFTKRIEFQFRCTACLCIRKTACIFAAKKYMHLLVDTHAHLYSRKFENDRHDMVQRAIAAGVTRIYLPNIEAESIEPMLALEAAFPDNCFAMMGLHPCSVQPDTLEKEMAALEHWLGQRTWAGIGETGIDLHWDKTTLPLQQQSFARHIEWAKDLGRPLIIHSREANREALDLVKAGQDGRLRGIFHCFSGTLDEAREMIDLGFMLGIGGTLTYPKSDLPAILKAIPLEHLVLETDAPYLPPVPHRGKRNESAYVRLVAEMLSEVKVLPLGQIAKTTTENALRMFA
jgi:TatD DNase family protein